MARTETKDYHVDADDDGLAERRRVRSEGPGAAHRPRKGLVPLESRLSMEGDDVQGDGEELRDATQHHDDCSHQVDNATIEQLDLHVSKARTLLGGDGAKTAPSTACLSSLRPRTLTSYPRNPS